MITNAPSAQQSLAGTISDSLATFYRQRWLVWYFVHRQMTRRYKNSFLGFFWAFLSPLLMVALLSLVFSEALNFRYKEVEGGGALNFGLYLYCGILPFLAYSDALSKGVNCIKNNSSLVEKIVFPLEFLPFSVAVTSLVDKLFGFGALVLALALTGEQLHPTLLLLPAVVALQLLFMLGLSYLVAVAGTYVPDIGEALRTIVRATFFATPIIWPVSRVPDNLRWIVDYNPLAYLVGAYRDLILEGRVPGGTATLYFFLFAVVLLIAGFALFTRVKARFAELL